MMLRMSSWGTCGFGRARTSHDENNHGLPDTEKIAIGQRCKMALDIGRMLYLQQHGFQCEMHGTSLALLHQRTGCSSPGVRMTASNPAQAPSSLDIHVVHCRLSLSMQFFLSMLSSLLSSSAQLGPANRLQCCQTTCCHTRRRRSCRAVHSFCKCPLGHLHSYPARQYPASHPHSYPLPVPGSFLALRQRIGHLHD